MKQNMNIRLMAALCGFFLVLGTALGLWAGYGLYRPDTAAIETPAAAVPQADGSLVLERKPDPEARPVHQVPAGAKVERLVQLKVRSKAASLPAAGQPAALPCPPVDLDLSLVRMPDDTQRVIANSGNGEVIAGTDIPITSALPAPPALKWAAGLSYSSDKKTGAWLDRDMGPFRIGLDLQQDKDAGIGAQLRLGIRF